MNPYEEFKRHFGCSSYQELYTYLKLVAQDKMGLDAVPFPLSALEHPHMNMVSSDVNAFIIQCYKAGNGDNSEAEAKKLISFLKENPPQVNYQNPTLPEQRATQDERNLSEHVFSFGLDLPGSKFNPFGHLQYYSSFFIDMFFGNYTEFIDTIKTLSEEELQRSLNKREGYCQYSPIFSPIVGIRMVDVHLDPYITIKEKQKIKTMFSGNNENKHLQILTKLIELGVDVNAYDINGYTPLHYAVLFSDEDMVRILLKHGANPNAESRDDWRPLSNVARSHTKKRMSIISDLVQYNAMLNSKRDTNDLRSSVEDFGSKELAVRVREAMPREKEECEKCVQPAKKKCSACCLVYYCSIACQKQDYKFHKITCKKVSKGH